MNVTNIRHTSNKGVMVTVSSWILLGLAIADILFALVLLALLRITRLIIDKMKPMRAGLVIIGPSVVVFMLAILAINLPPGLYLYGWPPVVLLGYIPLAIVFLLQSAAFKPALRKLREREAALIQRNRAMNYQQVNS